MVQSKSYEIWGAMLQYPAEGGTRGLLAGIDELVRTEPLISGQLAPMRAWASEHSDSDLEEAFTQTFDSNAERALEVGWHLHGENYARGVFMVRMRQLLRDHDIEESSELPDHVSHLLAILARAKPELRATLAKTVAVPALRKVVDGFPGEDNPYRCVVGSLLDFLQAAHPAGQDVETVCHE